MPRRPPSRAGRAARRALAAAVQAAGRGAGRLPPGPAAWLGAGLGEAAYWLLRGRRRVALANLEQALGASLPASARRRLARANFRHLGVTALECCRLFFGQPGALLGRVRVEGAEHARAAAAAGRGLFFLTAHYGNWELLAAAHGLTGMRSAVVVRPLDDPHLDALLTEGRARSGLRVIPKRRAVREVVAALGRQEAVGILLDQDAGQDGAFVPFLGQPASTSRSLAVLALKTGAPVVPVFLRRLEDGGHLMSLGPPIPVERTGDRARDVTLATARFTAAIEAVVRAHPEQWFWVHRRWKTRPA